MSYEINDRTLIEEMCGEIRTTAQEKYNELQENLKKCGNALPENLHFLWMRMLLGRMEH